MAESIGSAWRTFWHSMTSYDRHASPKSAYHRPGQGLSSSHHGHHAPLTSVSTSAVDSRTDSFGNGSGGGGSASNGSAGAGGVGSPTASQAKLPYSPGPAGSPRNSSVEAANPYDKTVGTGEIQMQNFSDGLPPPPPVSHSWKRIDRWAEDRYEELADNLCDGCTANDVNELEMELDCSLPLEVRESLQIHDGQERGGLPTGIIFGCMLLDCEEIVDEWANWRKVTEEYLSPQRARRSAAGPHLPHAASSQQAAIADVGSSASPSLTLSRQSTGGLTAVAAKQSLWADDLLAKQDSQPPNAVRTAYAHPGWIPLARDWGGNNIAVDLAPGPTGRWGQVIIIGRDYDCKYVIARSWAAFLATVADDLASENVHVDDESGDLKLLEFRKQKVEPPYLEILRWRADQKYGPRRRRQPHHSQRFPPHHHLHLNQGKKQSQPYGRPTSAASAPGSTSYANGLQLNLLRSNGGHSPSFTESPYASPTATTTPYSYANGNGSGSGNSGGVGNNGLAVLDRERERGGSTPPLLPSHSANAHLKTLGPKAAATFPLSSSAAAPTISAPSPLSSIVVNSGLLSSSSGGGPVSPSGRLHALSPLARSAAKAPTPLRIHTQMTPIAEAEPTGTGAGAAGSKKADADVGKSRAGTGRGEGPGGATASPASPSQPTKPAKLVPIDTPRMGGGDAFSIEEASQNKENVRLDDGGTVN